MTGEKSRPGPNHLGRSAGPMDVTEELCWTGHPKWLLDSAIRSIGPYVEYPGGTVVDRATGGIIWRKGDKGERPRNPERATSSQPHTKRSF